MKEYFWLTQDTRNRSFEPSIPDSIISSRAKTTGNFEYTSKLTQFESRFSTNNDMEFDVLDRGVFMVSRKLKEIIDILSPQTIYREFYVTTSSKEIFFYYYLPILPVIDIDCKLITLPNLDNEKTLELTCDKTVLSDITKIRGDNGVSTIVSLAAAEAILRTNSQNIRLIPVEFNND